MELSVRAQCAKPVSPSTIPPHLRCIACQQPLANGFQTPQGFRLCQPCVFNLHPTNGVPCPGTTDEDNDNNVDGEQQRFVCRRSCLPDTGTRLEISTLTVFCLNCDLGCPERMNWKLVEKHLSQACDFEKVVCSFCQKEVTVCRLHLFHHNLESNFCCAHFRGHCAYCGFCGYGGDTLSRPAFLEHAKTCSQVPVDCQFSEFGCLKKPKRCELSKHNDQSVSEHMLLMCGTVKALQTSRDVLEKENRNLRTRINLLEAEQQSHKTVKRHTRQGSLTSLSRLEMAQASLRGSFETIRNQISAAKNGGDNNRLPSSGHRRTPSSPFPMKPLLGRIRTASESLPEETKAQSTVESDMQ